ncbi:hybrid sensor histidine kinase/response regulator [Penaeicola halotolerans]|uniref:hybrid sensor histidine kinase/response regulator n=1 Tax=Penaeicola halotolerans TaxID=2793196 RepID=UPI001CF87F5A|nr:hybrid sensor histidine kinase/response regulator [Penaeicola halotolerans]
MSEQKINILYVDDEFNNLTAFKAGFRLDYQVFTALNAKEGMEILDKEDIHIIVADQRMPEITGVQFFESIREKHPDPIRILLTGYSDINAVIDAINKGKIYHFIDKPWDQKEIKVAINNAYEIYRTRKELKAKNESLVKAYEELNKFVYSVSHDLRSPLMSILGVVKLAKSEPREPESLEYFEMIEKMVNKLDEFIHNIINYYKTTREEDFIKEIDFNKLVKEIMGSYEYLPESKHIEFDIQIDQPEICISDEVKMKIILSNLISNAIKYQKESNDQKRVKVEIKVDQSHVHIAVTDNGIGIEDEYKESIFKIFFRATQRNVGSGIGLYIVKESIHKLGGEIHVSSQFNEGSKFVVKLPSRVALAEET